MAIRCSLTGHAWSDVRTDVERDEGLEEVAITQVEYRECERCGEVDVLSENTEVTAMAGTEDDGGSASGDGTADDGASGGSGGSRHVETDDDAVIIDAEMTASEAAEGDAGDGSDGDEEPGYVGTRATTEPAASADDGTYRCPDCGFREPAAESSHRPGDLCPRCASGYLVEKE